MRLKKVFEIYKTVYQGQDPLFKGQIINYKKKEDNSTVQYIYDVDIPDLFVLMNWGDRKINKYLDAVFKDTTKTDTEKIQVFKDALREVKEANRWKWAALMESMETYFNPLYNVDGTEETTSVYAQRQTTDQYGQRSDSETIGAGSTTTQHGAQQLTDQYGGTSQTAQYGSQVNTHTENKNGQFQVTNMYGQQTDTHTEHKGGNYVETTQYGQDTTTQTNAPTQTTEQESTNPFNDADTSYNTSKKVTDTIQVVDSTQRAQHTDSITKPTNVNEDIAASHTDTITYGTHTDEDSLGQHSDTVTSTTHTDTHSSNQYSDTVSEQARTNNSTIGQQTNTHTDATHTDTVTVRRFGNIGVTKSTELLESYMKMQRNIMKEIMRDYMEMISIGW